MSQEQQYTVINHKARNKLGISIITYCIADSIRVLGSLNPENKGWTTASKSYIANFIKCSERMVYKSLNELEKGGLIERNTFLTKQNVKISHLRTTPKFNKLVLMKGSGTEKSAVPLLQDIQGSTEKSAIGTEKSADNNDCNKDYCNNSNKDESKSTSSALPTVNAQRTSSLKTEKKLKPVSEEYEYLTEYPFNFDLPAIRKLLEYQDDCINDHTLHDYANWWKEMYFEKNKEGDAFALISTALKKSWEPYNYYEWGLEQARETGAWA